MFGKLFVASVLCAVTAGQRACPLDNAGFVDFSNQGLTYMYIDANTFTSDFDCKPYVANITSLDLSNNQITSVDVDSFAMFYELLSLNLSHNDISTLDNSTFIPLRKLQELDVSYNSLTKLQGGLISLVELQKVWFNNNNISEVDSNIVGESNVALVYFNMNNNSLTFFDPWPYNTYQSYQRRFDREFFFQHNQIAQITNYMNWTYNLRYPFEVVVNLQFNQLPTVSFETLSQYDPSLKKDSIFAAFLTYQANITNNPFVCDCNLYLLASIVRGGIFRFTRVEEYRYRCGSPASVEGIDLLHDLPLDKLVCNVTDNCPAGCHCEDRPHNNTFFMNCSNAGLTEMPDEIPSSESAKLELILDNNRIIALKNTSYLSKVYNISLAGNQIENIDTDVIHALNASRLDFRNNKISTIPRELRKFSYSSVLLSGNPLECDCDSMWLVDWLTLDGEAGDLSLTCDSKTGNRKIVDISLKALGCTNELLIIICVCLGVVLVLLAIALVFAKRCPYETRALILKFFGIRTGKKYEVDIDENKEVDIYIVFDDSCEDVIGWVRYFLKKLNTKKPLYSVLNPARFMEPGSEAANIPKWIGKSKRVIIILSEKIFENEWRCFEIDDAERRVIEAATLQNAYTNADSGEHEMNDLDDLRSNGQNGDCVLNMGDESLENAPKIIYVIFNSSDLLKAKLDEDKWIERIGNRRKIRRENPNDFDQRASEWQEKLQQEPWKSRLAGKTVLSPDDRMFWSKLRFDLPPTGNGTGDGNFTFGGENTDQMRRPQFDPVPQPHVVQQPRPKHQVEHRVNIQNIIEEQEAKGERPPQFREFYAADGDLRVHKGQNEQVRRSEKQASTNKKHCNDTRVYDGKIFTVSKSNGNLEMTAQNKMNETGMDKRNGLLNVLENVSENISVIGCKPEDKQTSSENASGSLLQSVIMKAARDNETRTLRPGSGGKKNIDSETSKRIFTVGTKTNKINNSNSVTYPLAYSRTVRGDAISNISSSPSSSFSSKGNNKHFNRLTELMTYDNTSRNDTLMSESSSSLSLSSASSFSSN